MSKRKAFLGLVCAVFLLVLTGPASAQSIWIDRGVDRAIWLEVQKPKFSKEFLTSGGFFSPPLKSTFATSAVFLSARWRVSGPLVLRAEIPFINVGFKDQTVYVFGIPQFFDGTSENQFGNPLVGMEVGGLAFPLSGEFGVRFPVVDDEHFFSSEIGSYIDFNRFEAFSSNLWTFTAATNLEYKGPTGLLLRFRTGPSLFVPTESGSDAELFADYAAQAGYQYRNWSVLGGAHRPGLAYGKRSHQ